MKRFISVITAFVVLAVCLCPSFVLAAKNPTFEVSSAKAARNEGAQITISVKNSPGITSAKLKVDFDPALTLKQVVYGDKMGGSTMAPKELKSPVTLNWFLATDEFKGDAVFATLTFAAGDKAKNGDYKISVSYDKEDVFNLKEKNVKFETVDGKLTVTGDLDETITADGETGVTTTGDSADAGSYPAPGTPTGDGDYTGGEVLFDDDGNVIEQDDADAAAESGKSDKTLLWIGIAAAALLIIIAVFVIFNGKKAKSNLQEAREAEENTEE